MKRTRGLVITFLFVVSNVVLFLLAFPVQAAGRQRVRIHIPAAVARLKPIGLLGGAQHLQLAIGLPLRSSEVLTNVLRDIYNPASPDYHHFLTPQQFAERFGPSKADYEAVIAFAKANGLKVTGTHPNRLLVDVNGSVSDIERALHVMLRVYQHPTEARTFYAPDAEPTLNLAVPILNISGLNNFSLPRPRFVTRPSVQWQAAAPNAGSGPGGTYMGTDFRSAYVPGTTLTGAGQAVGLLQFDGYTASDISYYEAQAGLPAVTLTNVLIDGASGLPSGSGGEVEVSLDIEMAISMAPGLSRVIVYEAPNGSPFVDILNRMATDNLASQLSCSWYVPSGAADPEADLIFEEMAAQGQSFFNASGDNDAYTGLIDFPGDSPYITQVGGTTLTTSGPGGVWQSETVWNWGNGTGSGGGISTQYPIPYWQTNIAMAANQGSTTMRNTPDVALTADNIYVRADGLDHNIGGTSCAAPLWAGFMALVNQQAATFGESPVGFINPALDRIGSGPDYPSAFHDITSGDNTSSSSPSKFYAVTGYDLCTGWGTPKGQNLIDALLPPVIVTLPASATEGDGLLAGAGHVQWAPASPTNIVIELSSSDPAQVSVPATVTVSAGQSNAVFDLTILDDGVLDGTQIATITASVPGIGIGSAGMAIFDHETATLQVQLPTNVIKGQGAVSGTVQVSAPVATNVAVTLSSDAMNLIQVPASVIIPTGQTSAVFTATILTDGRINGGQSVDVTAHVQNWTNGTATVAVQDNLDLTVALPASAWENAGVLTNAGSVRMAGTSAVAQVISLASDKPNKLTVPATVTILAGALSNTFNVTLVNNSIADGHQTVTVTASAPGFTNGSASMLVLDDESPPIPSNPRPGNLTTNVPANTNLIWNNGIAGANQSIANGDFETGTFANWSKTNNGNGDWVINDGTYDPPGPEVPAPPYAGSFSAESEQTGGGTHVLYQDITIPSPATSATLSWADRIHNFAGQFTTNTQYFHVEIRATNNALLQLAFTTSPGDPLTNDWTERSFDLTPYIGQTVRIAFVESDSLGYFNVGLDNVGVQVSSQGLGSSGIITNDVYFGTNPTPGPAEFQGSTTNSSWTLPLLAPLTTYYWQIVAHRVGSASGPVWQFTTAGVDHFAWSSIPSPQMVNQPFNATITAIDAFDTTVTNFTGAVSLQCFGGGGVPSLIEDFESGVWPHAPWVSVGGTTFGTVSSAFAHDGNFGLSDPEWMYRTDVSVGGSGDMLSWWVRPGGGRAYLGFGASSSGCWSIVAAPNTSQFILQQNSGYNYTQIAASNQTWQTNQWYKVTVRFLSASSVTCDLYASDGATLLNTLSYTNVTGLPGGVAMRSFGAFALDTIGTGGSGTSLPLSPTNTGNFVNGVWNGNLTVQEPATNVTLIADDGNQHRGSSVPFDVNLANDLSIGIVESPQLVSAGVNLTYTLTVANTGPTTATGVMVTNILPSNITFVSAASSQGTCTQHNGVVTCNLGTVPGGTNATMAIVVVPETPGATLTDVATVSRLEADAYLGNNTATSIVRVAPAVSIADASMLEGNVGTNNMSFAVTLNAPSDQTITVNYATADGGTATPGSDYLGTNGVLTFPPGTTNQSVAVPVIGDTLVEPDETFYVDLLNPTNATLGRSQAIGTIINDDGLPGQADHFTWSVIPSPQFVGASFAVTINVLDASNNPATNFNGTVTLSGAGNHGAVSLTPASVGPFTAGHWTGELTVNTVDTNVILTASDGNGHTGNSNPFYLIGPGSTFIPAANRADMVEDSARGLLYITDGNQVLRYDLNSSTFLSPFVFGTNLCGIDISPDNNTLIVADTAAYNDTNVWVYVVNLTTDTVRQANFARAFYEGGTYAVAFGNDGAALISSEFLGSGWTPLRRYDPVSGDVTTISSPSSPSMVSSSGDGRIIAVAEGDISSGPLDRYDVASQTITGSVGDGWFNFEVGVNRNGSQYAVPTYGGTFIYNTNLNQIGLLGSYAGEGPIGVAYDPQADLLFCAWWPTSYLRVYETHTMAEVARYDCGYNFGWIGNGAFQQGRVRTSRDGNNIFVTVGGGVRWISRPVFPPADLALDMAGSANPIEAGSNLTYTITVTNHGPNGVTDARVFDRLPANVTFVSATASQGTCTLSNGLVTCTLGAISNAHTANVNIVIVPTMEALLTNVAAIYSSATDPNPDNNAATSLITVHGIASLAVAPPTGLASSGNTGGPFSPSSQTYTLTNNGTATLSWAAYNSANWLSLSLTSGTLAPGTTTTVTVSINSAANNLSAGNYSDSVTFTNLTNGSGTTVRSVSLTVIPVGILTVVPANDLNSAGPRGGPFNPVSQTYALTNIGDGSLTWFASASNNWISLSMTDGILGPGASTNVTVSINNTADSLARGFYTASVGITNVTNGRGNTSRNVTLTVNTPPVALPQTVTLAEDGSTVITLQGTDADYDPLTAIITTLPAHGTLYQTADGVNPTTAITTVPATVSDPSNKVVFALGQHGYGNDYGDFAFEVYDGLAYSGVAQVTVNVTHVNHPPTAVNDTIPFLTGTTQVVFNVLTNDADVDGDPLTVQSFTLPARGTLTQLNNGQFRYQPNPDFTSGQDQFNYTVVDGKGGVATAQVTFKAYSQYLAGGDWSTFGNGPSHTGYYPAMLGNSTFVAAWSTNLTNNFGLNQVAVGGGNVYVTPITYFGATYLTALNAVSGQPAWQYDFPSAFSINPPTCDHDRVYVQRGDSESDSQLWCINAADGSAVWSAPFGAQWERYYAPTVYGNGIWVDGGYGGGMYGFDTNGTQRFFYSGLAQYDQWTPTYYQGTIYTWVAGGFRAHDPLTGNVLWTLNLNWNWDGYSMNTVPAIDNGRAFVQQRPNLIAIDLASHTNVWQIGGGVTGSPAVANGIVYAIIGDGVQAFAAQDGTPLGVYEATNDTGLAWQPIVTDDALFVSSSSATYIFNLASHRLLQTIPYGGPLSLANGWLYIAGQDGWLRAYTIPSTNPPAIITQPASQAVTAGHTASFSVTAYGALPLSYQWKFNGADLSGATNMDLTLTNVQLNQAGNYTVLVSNVAGSILSSNAVLTVYADHFAWNPISSPQTANIPFGVTVLAKDAADNTLVGYTNPAVLYAMTTNRPGSNLDFEAGTLAPWTPLNVGASPGPYQLVSFDVNGDGTSSTAFRIAANSGTPDGITQNVPLTGGVTYTVEMDIATDDTSGGNNADGGTTAILIGGTTVAQFGWGSVNGGQIYRTNLYGIFTPPTNGLYPVTLTFYRGYLEASGLWCLADDLQIIGPAGGAVSVSPVVTGNFTNGIWSGNLRVLGSGTNVVLIADDGIGHRGVSVPFNVLSSDLPYIITQPVDQTVVTGQNTTFTVLADGAPPLNYQWKFGGKNVAGATNTMLTLTRVQLTDAGSYSVAVTNSFGSVVSSNALLAINPPPVLGAVQSGGLLLITWPSDVPGFGLETTPGLSPANWTPVTNPPAQIGNEYLESIQITGTNQFYRLRFSQP